MQRLQIVMLLNYLTELGAAVILSFKDEHKMLSTACLCSEKRNRSWNLKENKTRFLPRRFLLKQVFELFFDENLPIPNVKLTLERSTTCSRPPTKNNLTVVSALYSTTAIFPWVASAFFFLCSLTGTPQETSENLTINNYLKSNQNVW